MVMVVVGVGGGDGDDVEKEKKETISCVGGVRQLQRQQTTTRMSDSKHEARKMCMMG